MNVEMMTDFERDVLNDIAKYHVDRGVTVLFEKRSLESFQALNTISYTLAVKDYWENMLPS